jgi:hypothetical protein
MKFPVRSVLPASVVILVSLLGATDARACPSAQVVNVAEMDVSRIATKDQPAAVELKLPLGGAGKPQALELAVKATRFVDGAPYVVRVFAGRAGMSIEEIVAKGQALGNFSLFSTREGEVESFVVDPPNEALLTSGETLALAVQIIPANPAANIGDSALEVIDAQLIE